MIFAKNWIGDYVDLPADPQELADRLTAAGLAVDEVQIHGDDALLDIDITTNRPDAMNHLGLAREAAVLFGKTLKLPSAGVDERSNQGNLPAASEKARLVIEDTDLCPRYDALVIEGVKVGPSPGWLKDRLEAIGSRSINNIVDVTNYVLWETGQPLHAFDLAKIGGAEVRVRLARSGEELVTLDGEKRSLSTETLVIADAEQPIALAGIMGGFDSEVTEVTTDVLLESAHFDPGSVRRTAKRLGMHTDASHRFERGADPEACLWVAQRAAALMVEVAGGQVLSGHLEQKELRAEWPPELALDLEKLNRFGGLTIDSQEVEDTLTGLGFRLVAQGDGQSGQWHVRVPSWRYYDFDNAYPADLYEEVLRIHGFDSIESALPQIGGADAVMRPEHLRARQIRDTLAAGGLAEAINFAFHDRQSDESCPSLYSNEAPLLLANPLSDRYAVMRRSLLPNLVESARYNQRRGASVVRLFELGHIFCDDGAGSRLETETVAVVIGGRLGNAWERAVDLDFFDLKGILENLGKVLGLEFTFRPASLQGLTEGAATELFVGDRQAGFLGQLEEKEGSYPLFVAELETAALAAASTSLKVQVLSKYPGITVDSTLTHSLRVTWAEIDAAVRAADMDDLVSFGLKDRYQGEGVPEGAVNSTFYFQYNAEDRSLTQEEVNERHQQLASSLQERFAPPGLEGGRNQK